MYRAAKWKAEKSKVKIVFRLQLHATQVPQPGWDKLFVSLIPVETGKATAKTTKVSVRNGSCKWSDPIYETARLLQDAKTRKYDEKLYKLVVSTGSSRFGFLGEANINLADYAEALKPSLVSLPLQSCSVGTTLHVTVQPLTAKTGFREFEQQREHAERGFHIMPNEEIANYEPDRSAVTLEETTNGHGVKDTSRATAHSGSDCLNVSSMQQNSEAAGKYRGYIAGDAFSPSDSESNCITKQEVPDIHEIGSTKNGIHQDAVNFLSSLSQSSKPPKSGNNNGYAQVYPRQTAKSSNEWTHGWSSDHSTENDTANMYEENERLRANLQIAESSILELKPEIALLERQAEGLAAEVETVMQQLTAEVKQGQDFAREISALKSECDSIKSEFEQLKALGEDNEKHKDADNGYFQMGDARHVVEALKGELNAEKQLNLNLNLQLEKMQRSYSNLLLGIQEETFEKSNKQIEQILCHSRHEVSTLEEQNYSMLLQDFEIEWLQKIRSSEEKIREIKERIVLKDNENTLRFLQDDLEVLERAFVEVRQENISTISKLNSELITRNKRIADLEYAMQRSSGKISPSRSTVTNLEANSWSARNLDFHLGEDETHNYNRLSILHDLPHLQNMCLQLDAVHSKLESRDQKLEEAGKLSDLDIAELELQLSVAEQEVQLLPTSSHRLETEMGDLNEEKPEVQNHLGAVHEGRIPARVQNGEPVGQMVLAGRIDSEWGFRINRGMPTAQIEDDHEDVGRKLFHLEEQNTQLLERISDLEAQLKHEIEKEQARLSADKECEEFLKIESKLVSTLELEEKVSKLSTDAEDYKRARDSFAKETEQMKFKYEALIQELEERAMFLGCSEKQLQEELQKLRDEHAASLCTVCTLEIQVEKLQQELDEQEARFAADRDDMALSKLELEQRVNRAETALRKARWNNASTVEQLQKELERLSLQISSTFDANEKLATRAFAEASQLRAQMKDLEEYSTIMQESLRKADAEIVLIREQCQSKVHELTTQLDLSKKHEEELVRRLQSTLMELEDRAKSETSYIARNEDLSVKNLMLETQLQAVLNEKIDLIQKVTEYNDVKAELESHKISFDGCKAERAGLEISLQRVNWEKDKLEKELSSLKETLRNSDTELDELKRCRDELEITVTLLRSKLEDHHAQMSFDNEQKNKLIQLHSQHRELKHRLLEQELKAEDMKHLLHVQKELQQKADAEISRLHAEKNKLEENSTFMQESLKMANAEITFIQEQCDAKMQDLMAQLDGSNKNGEEVFLKLQNTLDELENRMNSEINCIKRNEELSRKLSVLETEAKVVLNEKNDLIQKVKKFEHVKAELESNKMSLDCCKAEKAELAASLQRLNTEKGKLESELSSLKETVGKSDAELNGLKCCRNELETTVTFLQSKLEDQNAQISFSNEQSSKLMQLQSQYIELKHTLSEQELNAEGLREQLSHSKELQQRAYMEASQLQEEKKRLEEHSAVMQESLQRANAEIALIREQFEAKLKELLKQLDMSKKHGEDLLSKLQSALEELENRTKSETNFIKRNEALSMKLSILEKEVETLLNEKRDLNCKECEAIKAELQSSKVSLQSCEVERAALEISLQRVTQEKGELEKEISSLKETLRKSELELEELKRCNDELQITAALLQAKLDDQHAKILFDNEQKNELMQLRGQHSKLKHRLSEQELKTEDLRRHSIFLKELLQKADAEASQFHAQKKDLEEHSTAMQESLRVAFIREQCEAKVQELSAQLGASKKHGEELLLKLQDTLSELESRRKRETQHMKKNEELSIHLSILETEVQSILNEKSDILQKLKECESAKTELETNKARLESCEAEKAELDVSLQRVNLDKCKLDNELCSLKEMLRNSDAELSEMKRCREELERTVAILQSKLDSQQVGMSFDNKQKNDSMQFQMQYGQLGHRLLEQESKTEDLRKDKFHLKKEPKQKSEALDIAEIKLEEKEDGSKVSGDCSPGEVKSKTIALETSWQQLSAKEQKLQNNIEEPEIFNEYVRDESLSSSMDRLHKELEKMKNENLAPFQQENEVLYELGSQDPLLKEVQQLQMVNEQLENMFPGFKDPAKGGNAMDRVLALETELAEAMRANNTQKRHFQSSFVKQQTDQAAVLQSFRDINELINDMLELKRKNSMLEDELKEMQHRYSQVSLQFAEVEGERQQLVMAVKNLRIGKKP